MDIVYLYRLTVDARAMKTWTLFIYRVSRTMLVPENMDIIYLSCLQNDGHV